MVKRLFLQGFKMLSIDPLSTSVSLLNHARDGQQQAWSDLVRLYGPLVVQWCRQYEIQSCDSDDVVQNVFIAVSRHLNTYGQNSQEHSFRGWLWTIARSKIMDYLRKQKGIPIPLDAPILCEVSTNQVEKERSSDDARRDLQILVSQALGIIRQDFSDRTWNAFWRTAAMGESTSQVGRDLGMSSAAVCMCRARVLRRLRETLAES